MDPKDINFKIKTGNDNINKTEDIRENDLLSARLMDNTIEIKVKKIN